MLRKGLHNLTPIVCIFYTPGASKFMSPNSLKQLGAFEPTDTLSSAKNHS